MTLSLGEHQQAVDETFYQKYLQEHPEVVAPPRFFSIIKEIGPDTSASILDVGAGTGDLLLLIKQRGYTNIRGFDYSATARHHAASRAIHLEEANLEDPTLANRIKDQFDVVICGEVLEHIFDPQRVLPVLKDLLKDQGKLIITVPNAGWWLNGVLLTFFPQLVRLSPAFGVWTHVNQFTAYSLRKLLESSGLRLVKITGTGYWMAPAVNRPLWRTILVTTLKFPIYFSDFLVEIWPSIFSSQLVVVTEKG